MYGPAARRKRVRWSWILRSCTNVSGLKVELLCSGPSWISARVRSHKGECLDGPNVPSGFGCAGKTVLHLFRYLSQTSAGKGLAVDHAMSPHLVQFLVRTGGRSFVPTLQFPAATRAGFVKAGPSGPPKGLGLDEAEHGARLRLVGTHWPCPCGSQNPDRSAKHPKRCGRACWPARSPAYWDAGALRLHRSSA